MSAWHHSVVNPCGKPVEAQVSYSEQPSAHLGAGGIPLLILRSIGVLKMDGAMLEMITYHGIALGFIAMSPRVNNKKEEKQGYLVGAKSGAIIVGSYLIQAIFGLIVSLGLAYTVMPGLFKAAGILCPWATARGRAEPTTWEAHMSPLALWAGAPSLSIAARATSAPALWA